MMGGILFSLALFWVVGLCLCVVLLLVQAGWRRKRKPAETRPPRPSWLAAAAEEEILAASEPDTAVVVIGLLFWPMLAVSLLFLVLGAQEHLFTVIGLVFLAFDGLFGAVHFLLSKARIAVTAQRIVGSTGYGTRIDLPVESLLAVEPIACHGLAVRTRSGHVRIRLLADHAAVQSAISGLLSRR